MTGLVVLTTVPGFQEARVLAGLLVKRKLAACVSIGRGFHSVYRWKGRLERQREVLLLIKTSRRRFQKLKSFLEKTHPHEIPEIVGLPITHGSRRYLAWLESSLRP